MLLFRPLLKFEASSTRDLGGGTFLSFHKLGSKLNNILARGRGEARGRAKAREQKKKEGEEAKK